MRYPALLPENLRQCKTYTDEDSLFSYLVAHATQGLAFLIIACQDETWTSAYASFVQRLLQWVTKEFFQGNFSRDMLKKLIDVLQEHASRTAPFIFAQGIDPPLGVTFSLQDGEGVAPMLQMGYASSLLFELLVRDCWRTKSFSLSCPQLTQQEFSHLQEYWLTGENQTLWREGVETLVKLLQKGEEWEMSSFSASVSSLLVRYIRKDTVSSMLLEAHRKKIRSWKEICYDFINKHNLGIQCPAEADEHLTLRFAFLNEEGFWLFRPLCAEITQLGFGADLAEHPLFFLLIKQCPRLRALDLSASQLKNPLGVSVPDFIQELNVSACSWLTDDVFAAFLQKIPQIQKLHLEENTLLTYRSWTELISLKQLRNLNVRGCQQIGNEEALLILRSIPEVEELSFFGCSEIGDIALQEIPTYCTKLESLDVSGCRWITDATAVQLAHSELAIRCLYFSRCTQLSSKGIGALLQEQKQLEVLDVERCLLDETVLQQLRVQYPLVHIRA